MRGPTRLCARVTTRARDNNRTEVALFVAPNAFGLFRCFGILFVGHPRAAQNKWLTGFHTSRQKHGPTKTGAHFARPGLFRRPAACRVLPPREAPGGHSCERARRSWLRGVCRPRRAQQAPPPTGSRFVPRLSSLEGTRVALGPSRVDAGISFGTPASVNFLHRIAIPRLGGSSVSRGTRRNEARDERELTSEVASRVPAVSDRVSRVAPAPRRPNAPPERVGVCFRGAPSRRHRGTEEGATRLAKDEVAR